MFPAAAGYQVTAPAVGKLVCDNVHILPVSADEGRGSEGEDGILHAYGAKSAQSCSILRDTQKGN